MKGEPDRRDEPRLQTCDASRTALPFPNIHTAMMRAGPAGMVRMGDRAKMNRHIWVEQNGDECQQNGPSLNYCAIPESGKGDYASNAARYDARESVVAIGPLESPANAVYQ